MHTINYRPTVAMDGELIVLDIYPLSRQSNVSYLAILEKVYLILQCPVV
jgi:hypothetical protein